MRSLLISFLLFPATGLSLPSFACDTDTGERQQRVLLTWNGERISQWTADLGDTEEVVLPNGFELGIRFDDPGAEYYRELAGDEKYVWEIVKISLYDLSKSEPDLLTYTYGGTNSLQGYGARGGADRVEELGDPGIVLTLLKPACLEVSTVAKDQ